MRAVALLALLSVACSSVGSEPTEAAPLSPAPDAAALAPAVDPVPEGAQRLLFGATPEVAESVAAAVDLWRDATAGGYAPEIVVSSECTADMARCFALVPVITDCPLTPEGKVVYGCTYAHETKRIVVSEAAPADTRVSVLAHEIGHTLFLVHSADPADDLMNPGRSHDVRVRPCVSAEDASLAGFAGPGACLDD